MTSEEINQTNTTLFRSDSQGRQSKVEMWTKKRPNHAADGLAKGFVSFGSKTIRGITGVVSEPVKGAQNDGAAGFFKGVGMGLTGLVTKPVSGVVDFTSMTVQGVVNTPQAIGKNRTTEYTIGIYFGVPVEVSWQYCNETKRVHLLLQCIRHLEIYGLEQEGLFRTAGSVDDIQDLIDKFDRGVSIELSEYDIDVVCGLVQAYLKALPQSLIPQELFAAVLAIGLMEDENTKITTIVNLLNSLTYVKKVYFFELNPLIFRLYCTKCFSC
eukprot:TRINITY_DN1487_c0_g1_i3.p1 TRINITY_DN1487_c0_g1~~TRINITY_DN1487_c0_g1_i3.p1  ORF type:complete len:285 (-),score=50.99 TRINITY_DN1487_c0_g1_i3:289-1095(-)